MKSTPFFSVIVPVYNRADRILPTLRTVVAQTFGNWEMIIVDDGSRDAVELERAARSLDDHRIRYVGRKNGGGSAARNTGIDEATGDYIAFLDSDDFFNETKLEKVYEELERNNFSKEIVVFSRMNVERGVGRSWVKPDRGPQDDERIDEYLMCTTGWIQTSTIVIPTSLAKRVRFDERLPSSQDTDFAIRVASAGARYIFIKEPLVTMMDVYDPTRVSKQRKLEPLLEWIERMRGVHISEKSYWAYRGWQCARIASGSDKLFALRLFFSAAIRRAYRADVAIRIFAQIAIPQSLYQKIATRVVATFGSR